MFSSNFFPLSFMVDKYVAHNLVFISASVDFHKKAQCSSKHQRKSCNHFNMRSLRPLLFVSCVVLFLSETVNSYRILGIFPHVARSHYIMADSLMRGLAAKGHDVTLITPYNPSESTKNYRTIHLERTLSDAEGGINNLIKTSSCEHN